MAKRAMMNIALGQCEHSYRTDVDLVADGIAAMGVGRDSVVAEFRLFDDQAGPFIIPGQQAHLVALEETIAHRQPAAFVPYARAIAPGPSRAGEFAVFDQHVCAL